MHLSFVLGVGTSKKGHLGSRQYIEMSCFTRIPLPETNSHFAPETRVFSPNKKKLVGGFNPSEKILYSQIGSFPQGLGWKLKKYLSCHHPWKGACLSQGRGKPCLGKFKKSHLGKSWKRCHPKVGWKSTFGTWQVDPKWIPVLKMDPEL